MGKDNQGNGDQEQDATDEGGHGFDEGNCLSFIPFGDDTDDRTMKGSVNAP